MRLGSTENGVSAAIKTGNTFLVTLHLGTKNFLKHLPLVISDHGKVIEAIEYSGIEFSNPMGSG
jgi:hypothetical protein